MKKTASQTIRVALAQLNTTVGDLDGNGRLVIEWARRAQAQGADIVSFPELTLTGYPPEDLLLKPQFIDDNLKALRRVAKEVGDIVAVVGFADRTAAGLFNAAALLCGGRVRAVYHKAFLPNYGVFDEKRYFLAGQRFPVYRAGAVCFGVNICEDIWHMDGPAGVQAYRGAQVIVNINASPYHMGKGMLRRQILKRQARKNRVAVLYTNLVGGQDELVFDGSSMIVDAKGDLLGQAASFREELLVADLSLAQRSKKACVVLKEVSPGKPALASPSLKTGTDARQEVYEALVLGLRDYILKNGFKRVVLGLSGGIDSSLVAAIAADSVGKENVLGVMMPSAYTSAASQEDARGLAQQLGIEYQVIAITQVFEKYLEILAQAFQGRPADVAEENLQARIRGNILMALSNKFGYLALNTGNKSEVSCGYCTLYGDMAGGFGVIKDVPKTLVYELARYRNGREGREVIPKRVFEKAPTAELRPGQKDSDSLPEYGILDQVLKQYVEEDRGVAEMVRRGMDAALAQKVVRLVDASEYKRRQAPPGIKITPKAFGKDRRMPLTNRYR